MRFQNRGTCEHLFDTERGLVLVRLSGYVDGDLIADCAHAMMNRPEWRDTYDVIWDDRAVTTLDVTPGDLEQMVDAQTDGQVGLDLVVTSRSEHDLVMQLYAWRTRARGRPAQACTSMEEALAHVGLDELPEPLRP